MPKMDGLEVCRNIKREPELSGTKVIITTGFPDHPKLKEVANLGFANIYSKPVKLQDLLKAVDDCLRSG
jgi:CheY-like chemotaxis protein